MAKSRDFREFAFLATGEDTQLRPLGTLDVIDNLNGELRRLDAIAELMGNADQDCFDAAALPGMASLLDDISKRMRLVVEYCSEEVMRNAPGIPKKRRRKG